MKVKIAVVAATLIGVAVGGAFALVRRSRKPVAVDWAPAGSVSSPVVVKGEARALGVKIAWLPMSVARFEPAFVGAARLHGVDPEMLAIVTLVESGGWIGARSPSGARGLMQIMPRTGQAIADERGLKDHGSDKLGDAGYNIDFGAWYFARMLERFATEDVAETILRAASAYNGGPTLLARHLEGRAQLSEQTKRYRHWVGSMWSERRAAVSPTFDEWLAAGGERLVARAMEEMGQEEQEEKGKEELGQ